MMMVRNGLQALLTLLLVVSSACASAPPNLVPFSQKLVTQYSLSDSNITNLQYYVSNSIILQRELSRGDVGVTPGHTLRVVNDKRVEEVVILPKTPGIALRMQADGNSLETSFEEGKNLIFCTLRSNGGHGDLFRLCGQEWDGLVLKVDYGGLRYGTVGPSADAYLMIDLNNLNNFKKNTRVVKGRRLPS